MEIIILIKLFLAHILTDFVLQPNSWVDKKNSDGIKGYHFWIHSFLAGFLTYILLANWTSFEVPVTIFILHAIIDYSKIKLSINKTDETKQILFFLDQAVHLIVILAAWLYIINGFSLIIPFFENIFTNIKILSFIVAFIFITIPAGIIIGKITDPFQNQIDNSDGLAKAGIYIGITERILIFIFVIIGQYAAIGLLIAGKSILRVTKDNDNNGRKKTEYILIGTLISFTIAIITGLFVKAII